MARIPYTQNIVLIQNHTFRLVIRHVQNTQVVTLVGGPTVGTFVLKVLGSSTVALAYNASAATVAAAIQALPRVGANGATVSRSGAGTSGDPYIYTIVFTGALAGVEVALIEATPNFTPQSTILVDNLPFDWTGWTAILAVAAKNATNTGFDSTVFTITDATNPATEGKIYIGYVPPASEGGTPGTNVPTNGRVAIIIPASVTDALEPSDLENTAGNQAGWYNLLMVNGSYKKMLLKGAVTLDVEPS